MQDFWGSDYGTFLSLLFSCSVVSDSFVTPWTVVCQAPLSMEFSRQEYWSGQPFPSPENLPPATLDVIWRSVQFSHSVVSDSLQPHGFPVHHQFPELAQTHVHQVSDAIQPSYPLSVLSSYLQSVPASGFLPMSQFFESGGQSIGASSSASVLPMNIQCWFPLGWTGWVSLQSKGLPRVSCNITVQKHQFFSAQLSL